MQSLCTLRRHCRQWPRNTRYQAGAAPYLGRTFTGWIAPACLAHSFNHLVGNREELIRDRQTKRLGGLKIDHELKLAGLDDREVGWLFALQNATCIDADLTIDIR